MPKKKEEKVETSVKEKIEYIGLNFERVPKALIAPDRIDFDVLKGEDERQYKQYRFIKISEINILLTPKTRMDSLKERIEESNPLYMYLDSVNDENAGKYAKFLSMIKKVEINDIEKIEYEQKRLAQELPYRVKYNGNYLWQIFYSKIMDKYFMLVPTEDTDYSAFFYILKKKIEERNDEMIFVPISYLEYTGKILNKSEIKDLENYLWLFTKDYPSIYEVFDKDNNINLHIIGETAVYERIKTVYKMVLKNSKEANKLYKLLKALFILQVELPHYFYFQTKIDENGNLNLYLNDEKIEYEDLVDFISNQYLKSIGKKEDIEIEIEELESKLASFRQEASILEKEYLEKEKMISTFLECKKSFFGKVRYYFKLGKMNKKLNKKEMKEEPILEEKITKKTHQKKKIEERNYTLDELIVSYKELEIAENNKKNIIQDINAIKLKNKNLNKKIENAKSYINEINEHKKSIFEFWKYSNKDEVSALEEGEEETAENIRIEKKFDFETDFEKFSENIDKIQRMKFTDSELDSSYIATTGLIDVMNDIYIRKKLELKDFSKILKDLKSNRNAFLKEQGEEYDIFGNYSRNNNKENILGNKAHRENERDIYEILDIREETKAQNFKKSLVDVIKNIKRALRKNTLDEELFVYKVEREEKEFEGLQIFSLNDKQEIEKVLQDNDDEKIYLYRLKLKKRTNFIALSNIIYYNNRNMTLPVGMNVSNDILIDMSGSNICEVDRKIIKIRHFENQKDDFAEPVLKTIEVKELE